jgi:predicted AAA+ superfamily ATPase
MDKDSIKSLNEENKQIFLKQQGKFYYNLQNSNFLKSKGNINFLEKEIELRSKLLLTLARNPVNNADLRKILAIYYDNPTAVLQKARII